VGELNRGYEIGDRGKRGMVVGNEVSYEVLVAKAFATNCWILAAPGSDQALVVDPGIGDPFLHQAILERCAALKLHPVAILYHPWPSRSYVLAGPTLFLRKDSSSHP